MKLEINKKFLLAIVLISTFFIAEIQAQAIPQVDKEVKAFLKKWSIPGASIAITYEDRLVYAKGYGVANRESGEKVTETSLFRIASLSKPITSVAILDLVESGELRLNDKVLGPSGVLKEYNKSTMADEQHLQITVKQLLNHTAGFSRSPADPMLRSVEIGKYLKLGRPAKQHEIMHYVLTKTQLVYYPGEVYEYSNFGYNILGRVIERVTRKTYEEHVQERILKRCGIEKMKIGNTDKLASNEVRYYPVRKEPAAISAFDPKYAGYRNSVYLEAMDSHGGWIASSVDLARFLVHVNGYGAKQDLLKSRRINLMASDATGTGYGLGWYVNDDNWWHTGALPGTSSIMVRTNPDNKLGWVVLANSRRMGSAFQAELDQLMWRATKDLSFKDQDLFENYQ